MRYLTLGQVLELHRRLVERFGSSAGIRDLGSLESALAQPHMTFGGKDLYPTIVDKAAALGFSLVLNHPSEAAADVGHGDLPQFAGDMSGALYQPE
jgi:death-on-curing protein